MKNNKATWVFCLVFLVFFIWRWVSFSNYFQSFRVEFIFVYVAALYGSISFLDWVNKSHDGKIPNWIGARLAWFKKGSEIGFWERQIIFFGGLLVGLILLKFG